MTPQDLPDFDPDLDLVLQRDLNAPRELIYACWTTPEHLVHWFVPKPHRVTACHLDVRVGGACNTTFDVEGTEMVNNGVYLEVVPPARLVFTDAYVEAWRPSPKPFITAIITLTEEGTGTRYEARVRHWTAEDRARHEEMGFHEGWGKAADQLAELASRL